MGKKTLPGPTSEAKIASNRRNASKSPIIGNNGMRLKPGDNDAQMELNQRLLAMEKVDIHDPNAVAVRIGEYFDLFRQLDIRPTLAGLAIALDMYPTRIRDIELNKNDGKGLNPELIPIESRRLIIKAKHLLENNWESYMQNGKIHPIAGIFLGKNNFSYVDRVDNNVTTMDAEAQKFDKDELRKRYVIDSEFATDSGSDSPSDS